jgi:hypothetical protein
MGPRKKLTDKELKRQMNTSRRPDRAGDRHAGFVPLVLLVTVLAGATAAAQGTRWGMSGGSTIRPDCVPYFFRTRIQ